MDLGFLWSYYGLFTLMFFFYYVYDLIATKKLLKKHGKHLLVGSPSALIPRIILNLIFAKDAARVIEAGYKKFKNQAFQLIRIDGSVIVLPANLIEELSSLPQHIASSLGAFEYELVGSYTGFSTILNGGVNHSVVQRKLTPRLGVLTPYLESELAAAFDDYFPVCDNWTEITPFWVLGRIAARISARALVGPKICRNEKWLDVSLSYTEDLFKTAITLRLLPIWIHPIVRYLLPSYWHGIGNVQRAKKLLGPQLRARLGQIANMSNIPDKTDKNEEEYNVLTWLAEGAKGQERDPDALACTEVVLALASVHPNLIRMVNVLYDLTANPRYIPELRKEIMDEKQGLWDFSSHSRLKKLDSVLRESQCMSPPSILGMKRLFRQPYTFCDATHIPKGTYVCLPTFAIENDPLHTENPQEFDGLRSYRLPKSKGRESDHSFSTPEKTVLNFGYGKSACPGRFFASLIIKITLVKLLTDYEFEFLPGTQRPKNIIFHEFLFPRPWNKILVRRRQDTGKAF